MEMEFNKMKLEDKFRAWRATLTPRQRENIKKGIDVFILVLFVTTVITVYDIGKENGKIELCHDQNGVLVESRGLMECWPIAQYEAYIEQWDTNKGIEDKIKNGLQFNISG